MKNLWQLIKADYLQRTRSYSFIVTLCVALALGYSFVPPLDGPYSTVRIGSYIGNYNSAWFGSVMAIMSSVFISYFGYFIINKAIRRDAETGVGTIMGTTQTSNFFYLFSKLLSNFLVLLSLLLPVIIMSFLMFLMYGVGSFQMDDFLSPFVLVCLPTLALTAALALVFEVVFRKYNVLQYVLFSILFFGVLFVPSSAEFIRTVDPLGNKLITHEMTEQVIRLTNEKQALSIGYNPNVQSKTKMFDFKGVDFPAGYIVARMLWLVISIVLVLLSSFVFYRFRELSHKTSTNKQSVKIKDVGGSFEFELGQPLALDFSILPILKAELLLLMRKRTIWLWILTLGGMVALVIAPMGIAHQIVLPALWFIHLTKWSRLITKEFQNRTRLFGAVSYQPVSRLLTAQLLAAATCILILALPLVLRLIVSSQIIPAVTIILGGVFIVLMATLLGLMSKGSKLFEVLFFLLTYANLNAIPALDYFGAHHSNMAYLSVLSTLVLGTLVIVYSYKSTFSQRD